MPRRKADSDDAPISRSLPVTGELTWSNPTHLAFKADWKTPEILLEGSLGCAKTTVALDKEIDALLKFPGIPILLFRWTDDAVQTKLKPAFEEILAIRGIISEWDTKQKCHRLGNGSIAFMFGLKAVSDIEQFNKIRGLSVSRIMGDQVEEMKPSVAQELRGRLRPDLTATMQGTRFPFQLTFVANPDDQDFWLSKQFPLDNRIKGRKVFSLSVFDNPFLPQETIDGLIREWPPDHPKHMTMVLGQRGPNITGDPVFEGIYRKDLHWVPTPIRPEQPVYEGFHLGKHNPTWVIAQPRYGGGLSIIGGIRGEGLCLEDFAAVVTTYRTQWLAPTLEIQSCTSPMGGGKDSVTPRFTSVNLLKQALQIHPKCKDNGNAADVRLAMDEMIMAFLRRRNPGGAESFAANNEPGMFLIANDDGVRESPFIHHAFEGGFVWDDHFVSVGNKEVRQAKEDDKFANAMHCIEDICLNFCAKPEPAPVTPHQPDPSVPTGSSSCWI